MTYLAQSQVTGDKYWIDASTVGANWETTGFDDSAWTACPSPGVSDLVYLYNATGAGGAGGSNIGSVAAGDVDAATVFVRFWVPGCVRLELHGNVDDWIHTVYVNGVSKYTESSQTAHDFDVTVTSDLLEHDLNLVAIRTVNKLGADLYSFAVQADTLYEGSNWVVGYVSLG